MLLMRECHYFHVILIFVPFIIISLTLVFNSKENGGELNQFSFLDATGQLSNVTLNNFDDKKAPNADLFIFNVPDDVQIDYQR